jgi:hypothetical protein
MLLAGVPAQYGVPVGYPPFEQVSDFSSGILPLFPKKTP